MPTACVWSLSATSPIALCSPSHSQLVAVGPSWFRKWCAGQKRPPSRRRGGGSPNWAGRRGSSDRAEHQTSMSCYRRSVNLLYWICLSVKSQIQRNRPALHLLSPLLPFLNWLVSFRDGFVIFAMDFHWSVQMWPDKNELHLLRIYEHWFLCVVQSMIS